MLFLVALPTGRRRRLLLLLLVLVLVRVLLLVLVLARRCCCRRLVRSVRVAPARRVRQLLRRPGRRLPVQLSVQRLQPLQLLLVLLAVGARCRAVVLQAACLGNGEGVGTGGNEHRIRQATATPNGDTKRYRAMGDGLGGLKLEASCLARRAKWAAAAA